MLGRDWEVRNSNDTKWRFWSKLSIIKVFKDWLHHEALCLLNPLFGLDKIVASIFALEWFIFGAFVVPSDIWWAADVPWHLGVVVHSSAQKSCLDGIRMDFNELVISNDTELVVNSLLKSILGLLEPFCSKVQHPAKYLLLQELDGYRVVDIDWYHCPTSQKKSFAISIRDPASARPYNHHHPHFFSTSTQSPNTSAKYATIYNPCLPISPHKAQN